MTRVSIDVGGMTLADGNLTKREISPTVTLSMRWVLSIGNSNIFFTRLTIRSWFCIWILCSRYSVIKRLNAELNPICHLLVLLGDLTFMGKCIVIIFKYTRISNKMQRYTVYLYLETAVHVSGGTSTHNRERIQLYLQHLVFVTPYA
jgi:hypothetical protein